MEKRCCYKKCLPRAHHSDGENNTKMLHGNNGVQIKTQADVIFNLGRMQTHTLFEIYIRSIYILLLIESCLIDDGKVQ